MKICTSLSRATITADAIETVCSEVQTQLAGHSVDLAFVFFSPHHSGSADFLASIIADRLHPKVLLGCSAESIIEGKHEIEGLPALCLWAAHLPGADLVPFHVRFEQ